jgi:Ca2+-transporting ATPase
MFELIRFICYYFIHELVQEDWHNLSAEETLSKIGSAPRGLSEEEARKRLEKFGPNEIIETRKISTFKIFLSQFKNALIIILLAAVIISAAIGEIVDAIIIFIIVSFAALLGFVQEYRAEKAIEALKRMAAPKAIVIRGGREVEVDAEDLVPGDIILLKMGTKVPADARLIEAINLKADESALTGESVCVDKSVESIDIENPPLGDRRNMVHMGTSTVYGRGKAVVVTTGMKTEFGRIAGMLQKIEESKTPFQKKLDSLGKTLLIISIISVAVIFAFGILIRGEEPLEMFIWAIALAVAIVPEALPAVVVISLALGVRRMVKRHALIRKLPAVETLGSTTVICSDKTGTLTQDKMTVRKIFSNGSVIRVSGVGFEPKGDFSKENKRIEPDEHLSLLLQAGVLCNDAQLVKEEHWEIKGDATEGALVVAAGKAGMKQDDANKRFPRIDEIPFTSETKRMTTVHKTPSGRVSYSKGAIEVILDSCNRIYMDHGEKALTSSQKDELLEKSTGFASDALRVLGIAYKPISDDSETVETDMIFLGFVGMIDPPRKEARDAIKRCEDAGIKTVMITGDHKLTAIAVAKELGMLKKGIALEGKALEEMSDEEFEKIVEDVEVYARVSPEHKLRIVEAFKKKGHVIAMTGDGINDAPALKSADIGIAMGITGTDVTKEAADMILTDDNFASIVDTIEEGRGIFGNVKKYLMYLLSSNLGEILLMAVGVLIGLPLPLIAIQILWVNLATDGLPAIALSVDPAEKGIMKQKPRDPKESIFSRPVVSLMIIGGVWSAFVNLLMFFWLCTPGVCPAPGTDPGLVDADPQLVMARSMVFVTLILIQFFKAFNYRSDIFWETVLILMIVYMPFLQEPFSTHALTLMDWGIVILVALTIFPVLEAAKYAIRRGWFSKKNAK